MPNPYLEEENPYAGVDEIKPFEKILSSLRQSQFGPFPFIPRSGAELRDLPLVGVKGLSEAMLGIPELATGESIEEPQTEYGRQLTGAMGAVPLAFGGGMALKGLGALGKGMARKFGSPANISEVQKAFFPWVRKKTGEFGKALKVAQKTAIQEGHIGVPKKNIEALFGRFRSKDLQTQLPGSVKKEVSRILQKDTPTIQDLAKASARMRRALSQGERTGKQFTERSRAILDTEADIKTYLQDVLPGLKQAKQEYIPFAKIRQTMTEQFTPGELKYGKYGSEKAFETLRNIKQQPKPTIEAFKQFERETGTKFVKSARRAATGRAVRQAVGTALPWAALTGGLGLGGYLALKGLFSGASRID